jgi:hypothetical protein
MLSIRKRSSRAALGARGLRGIVAKEGAEHDVRVETDHVRRAARRRMMVFICSTDKALIPFR